MRIEDYALIGDTQSAALVGRDGSIDWLCFPRFDSGACFAALLGKREHGRWKIAPSAQVARTERRYRKDTLVLETDFETPTGLLRVVDCMPPRDATPDVVRVVECLRGSVEVEMELTIRFDYGSIVPWVHQQDGRLLAVAGPDALVLTCDVPTFGENMHTTSRFTLREGSSAAFTLSWYPSHAPVPVALDPRQAVRDTESFWREWVRRCRYQGAWREQVVRSLITLKALTYGPTGGIVAAPTTSLPERIGGVRNWDYRYCWLRDASLTLNNLYLAGYRDEARAFRDWVVRAVAGDPSKLQTLYGVSGERRATEYEVPWLPGYEGSKPVRVGNGAVEQLQLDVFGELMDALHQARTAEDCDENSAWRVQRVMLEFLEKNWQLPDESIWEVRGGPQHFVYSKVMAWVAFDRAIRSAERFHLEAPLPRWRALRDQMKQEILDRGFDPQRNSFTQAYGTKALDASLLRIPLVGFLPVEDPRMQGTIAAIERELLHGGFVRRYATVGGQVDGLPDGEGAFLACSFWLADNHALSGRTDDANAMFERLLALTNDVGLLAEEYDPVAKRMVGNFPQAFSHLALVNTAFNLSGHRADAGVPPADAEPADHCSDDPSVPSPDRSPTSATV